MGSSITSDHFLLSDMGLGLFYPSKSEFVAMLDSFFIDKRKKQIVR